MRRTVKAVCLGEILIDFISVDSPGLDEARLFHRCLGGAGANLSIGMHIHGVEVRLVSRVGKDMLGRIALDECSRYGISTASVAIDEVHPTRCSFIAHNEEGRRQVEIANRQSAEQYLELRDVIPAVRDGCALLYVSGVMMLSDTQVGIVHTAIDAAREQGARIAFDPVIDLERASPAQIKRISNVLEKTDILKANEREFSVLRRPEKNRLDMPALIVHTRGRRGAILHTRSHTIEMAALDVPCTDPTGAGDAFLASILASIFHDMQPDHSIDRIDERQLTEWGEHASRQAARSIQRIGAVAAYS